MAVISPAGVVGRIIVPSAHAAKVQLLIDLNAAAGALIERSRAQGVVVGTGTGTLRLDYVSGSAEIQTGDTVITSGIDGIYPKGFVIGRVEKVERSGGAYGAITVGRPSTSRCWRRCWSCSRRRCRTAPGRLGRCGEAGSRLPRHWCSPWCFRRPSRRLSCAAPARSIWCWSLSSTSPSRPVPTTGLLAGAAAGLAQDALSSGILGIGGLAKTVVGFVIGMVASQFIVVRPLPRFVVFFAATILHATVFMGLYELLGLAPLRQAVRRGGQPGRGKRRSSGWSRSSSSSSCRARCSGALPTAAASPADELSVITPLSRAATIG